MKKVSAIIIGIALLASVSYYAFFNKPSSSAPAESGPTGFVSATTLTYSIINTYPHDTSSFTQGLIVYKGKMYEGTGENGYSKLLQIDMKTGKAEREVKLEDKYFGEGITILNDTVYQLTWQNNVVFAYTLHDFKKVKEFHINTEGWGITTDGTNLIVSDGSSNLYFYQPSTFRLLRTQSVTDGGSLAYNLNELEYFDGYVYSNQWQLPYIFKIDPNSGQVIGKTDLTEMWNKIKFKDPQADVPNGIAYDQDSKKIYITGKKWPDLYEIQFGK
ncbi:MAG: glutaminyl-peptide cyclotransferase [Chitinophagaceae bacterium]